MFWMSCLLRWSADVRTRNPAHLLPERADVCIELSEKVLTKQEPARLGIFLTF